MGAIRTNPQLVDFVSCIGASSIVDTCDASSPA
jgi:hypothetical protein